MTHLFVILLIGGFLCPLNLHQEGLFAVAFFYIGRELAQAEYRCIQGYYNNHRDTAPWWCGFEPRAWNSKSVLDWLLPLLVAAIGWNL